jgi:hypothetical protein
VQLGFEPDFDSNDEGTITVRPGHIAFPPTTIGMISTMSLEFGNFGATDENVALAAPPPFRVLPSVTVPGGGIAITGIEFAPTEVGLATGILTLSSQPNEALSVTLEGEGTSRCLSGCNDGNACTLDLCDEQRGCFHQEVVCPPVTNVCQIGACDRALGCQVVLNMADGTPCGVSTCGGTTFCRAGQCMGSGRPTRLVGHWTFDEMDGTTIFDSSGLGHHGALVAGTRVPSRRNRGITHSNGSLLVEIMDHPDFAFLDSFTVEVWAETPDPLEAGQQQVMVFRGDAREGLDPLVFSMQPTGARFLIESEFGGMFVAPSAVVPPRTAVKLTGVFDSDALQVRVYRDCVLAEAECTTFTSAIRELNAGSNPGVGLGGHPSHGGSVYSFRGVLDEVRIHDGAMSPADVASSCAE